jgi:hypothetical protein
MVKSPHNIPRELIADIMYKQIKPSTYKRKAPCSSNGVGQSPSLHDVTEQASSTGYETVKLSSGKNAKFLVTDK